jgi:hypothetical protein
MTSPMLVAAPGAVVNWKVLLAIALIILFPILIGGTYVFFGWTFLGLSPKIFILLTIVLSIVSSSMIGYPRLYRLAFQGIPISGLFISDKGVYLSGNLIPGADPKTFESIPGAGYGYYRDQNHVYLYEKVIPEANPASFRSSLETAPYPVYSQDDKHVYVSGNLVPEADVKTFEVLGQGTYGRDSQHVFYRGKIIEGADPQSFEVTAGDDDDSPTDAKDKNQVYRLGKAVNI